MIDFFLSLITLFAFNNLCLSRAHTVVPRKFVDLLGVLETNTGVPSDFQASQGLAPACQGLYRLGPARPGPSLTWPCPARAQPDLALPGPAGGQTTRMRAGTTQMSHGWVMDDSDGSRETQTWSQVGRVGLG